MGIILLVILINPDDLENPTISRRSMVYKSSMHVWDSGLVGFLGYLNVFIHYTDRKGFVLLKGMGRHDHMRA